MILPALHVGRDAPLGAALILHYLAASGSRLSELVHAGPRYVIVKAKAPRRERLDEWYRALRIPSPRRQWMSGTVSGWLGRIAGST